MGNPVIVAAARTSARHARRLGDRHARPEGNTDAGVLASGQVVGALEDLPTCAELITRIVAEAEDVLARPPR